MNISKNMEAIFIIAIALTCITAFSAIPAPRTIAQTAISSGDQASITVVTITAKRLTAAQKAALVD